MMKIKQKIVLKTAIKKHWVSTTLYLFPSR